jgi:hypothetical protein
MVGSPFGVNICRLDGADGDLCALEWSDTSTGQRCFPKCVSMGCRYKLTHVHPSSLQVCTTNVFCKQMEEARITGQVHGCYGNEKDHVSLGVCLPFASDSMCSVMSASLQH